jgi:hypothetical protein
MLGDCLASFAANGYPVCGKVPFQCERHSDGKANSVAHRLTAGFADDGTFRGVVAINAQDMTNQPSS